MRQRGGWEAVLPGGGPRCHVGEPCRLLLQGKPTSSPGPRHKVQRGSGAQESGHMEAQAGAPRTSVSQQPDPCKWATGNTSGGAAGADERPRSPRVGGGQGGGAQTILKTGCWPVSAPLGFLPGEGTAVETKVQTRKVCAPIPTPSPRAVPTHTLTWIWLRRTAARRIMALARRWNSLPISRDFSKVVLR